jgi:hypothetical protein
MTEIADGPNPRPESLAATGETPARTPGPRLSMVRLAVAATVLFTLMSVALLGWKWGQVRVFPDMAVIIRGDVSTADTEVVVKCDDDQREVARTKLGPTNNYEFIVMIERSKRHTLRATYGTHVLVDTVVETPTSGNVRYDLRMTPEVRTAATAPVAKPGNGGQPP